ncbi:MAG TPA: hypothetical protein VIG25_10925 [Pyrinomonadaceae bacterium]
MPMRQRFLAIYSGALTLTFAVTVLCGFSSWNKSETFDQISVHRINVIEPDGTLRMVISNHDKLPGLIVHGKEQSFARPQAGMLFYNDEGSENGGLIFSGHRNEKGEIVDSGGSLTFDKYGENQIVQLAGVDDKEDKFAGLVVSDNKRRIWVGRDDNGNATISLMDSMGKKRILMDVKSDGSPSLSFLDADGRVISKFP